MAKRLKASIFYRIHIMCTLHNMSHDVKTFRSRHHLVFVVDVLVRCVRESQLRGWSWLLAEVWKLSKQRKLSLNPIIDLLMRLSRLEVLAIPSFALHSVTLPSSCDQINGQVLHIDWDSWIERWLPWNRQTFSHRWAADHTPTMLASQGCCVSP